jgi:hypothetical protein
MAAVFEKHLHYLDQYADMLETKIKHMEFANKIRIQLYLLSLTRHSTNKLKKGRRRDMRQD